MIHEIGVEINQKLAGLLCPFRVVDGPEATGTTTGARERIVIQHDESGDSFSPARKNNVNPVQRAIRNIGVKLTIYAQASALGSAHWEHRRRAEHVLDLLIVALDSVLKTRRNGYSINGGRFISANDLDKSEVIPGAIYELRLSIERGIYDTNWKYDKRPEVAIGGPGGVSIDSTTEVYLTNGPDSAVAEIGCGG